MARDNTPEFNGSKTATGTHEVPLEGSLMADQDAAVKFEQRYSANLGFSPSVGLCGDEAGIEVSR
jgi:hypothetical protein